MSNILGDPLLERTLARRSFLRTALGLGGVAAAELLAGGSAFAQRAPEFPVPGALGSLHFAPKAKRVINLYMLGGVSQVDTFDYKPVLDKMHGEEMPPSVKGDNRVSTMVAGQSSFPLIRSISPFKQYGKSGRWVSDLLPSTAKIVDDLCFVMSVYTPHVNHDPASKFLNTGFQLPGRPSQGAWINYGLGSENQNLPSFVVFISQGAPANPLDTGAWSAGFLPSKYQGVPFRSTDDPVLFLKNAEGIGPHDRQEWLQVVNELAGEQQQLTNDPEIASKIAQYEMAFRMQTSVPEIANIDDEPSHILEMYGPEVRKPNTFARNCLLARRLAERDVRFVSLVHVAWDDHFSITQSLPRSCQTVDQPVAALITDLKQRGLLDDTLVMWGSEFGRTSFAQGNLRSYGRDHHGKNFVVWFAGAGIKAGASFGETDDFSYNIAKNPVEVHDLHATMLHLMGVDHQRLTFKTQGREFRLTDVHGRVLKEILA